MASKSYVRSVSFKRGEEKMMNFLDKKKNISDYIKELIEKDMKTSSGFTAEQKQEIIQLIKKYAPSAKEDEIQSEFDKDAVNALSQFDNI